MGCKSNSNLKLLARTKEHEEPRRSDGQPERKGPQFSHLPTGKDALMLSKKLQSSSFLHSWRQQDTSPVGRIRAEKMLITDTGAEKTPITDTMLMAVFLRPPEDDVRCHSG